MDTESAVRFMIVQIGLNIKGKVFTPAPAIVQFFKVNKVRIKFTVDTVRRA